MRLASGMHVRVAPVHPLTLGPWCLLPLRSCCRWSCRPWSKRWAAAVRVLACAQPALDASPTRCSARCGRSNSGSRMRQQEQQPARRQQQQVLARLAGVCRRWGLSHPSAPAPVPALVQHLWRPRLRSCVQSRSCCPTCCCALTQKSPWRLHARQPAAAAARWGLMLQQQQRIWRRMRRALLQACCG